MIEGLSPEDRAWLADFFSAPNELLWSDVETESAARDRLDAIRPWIESLRRPPSNAPVVLPFYRNGGVSGWYATATTAEGERALRAALMAWFGSSYLTRLEPTAATNATAAAMAQRFGLEVLAFTGPEVGAIADRLALFAGLEAQRPPMSRTAPRPVGRIRSDLERALLARDEAAALRLIDELRATGRLNEENLRFLQVRLHAGLGHWDRIARDHWTIKALSDLPLPPQTLSDIVEALYRVYVGEAEDRNDPTAVQDAFRERLAMPFPRLFASRHGVRTPRIVKAFLLYEGLQPRPDAGILASLINLLPASDSDWPDRFLPAVTPGEPTPSATPPTTPEPGRPEACAEIAPAGDAGEAAFVDGQFDRAFELDLAAPLNRKSLVRLLSCVQFIGTAEAQSRLLETFDAQAGDLQGLPEGLQHRIETLRPKSVVAGASDQTIGSAGGWLNWAERLAQGQALDQAEADVLDNRASWEVNALRASAPQCERFADLIGNLDGQSASVARLALPAIVSTFFPEGTPAHVATRPIAGVVLILIAMDEAIAKSDLDILSTVLSTLLEQGMTTADYLTLVADLEAVQSRVGSYANLAWSLDICETLAVSPVPSGEAAEARLRFFLSVVGQVRGFAHRLELADVLPIEYLALDFGMEPSALADLRPTTTGAEGRGEGSDLAGKLVGVYTLTETAGARAKEAIERLYPHCTVQVNSDTVSTTALATLARTADIFVFAWRSSSHQAFYCIKDALGGRDPIYAAGKGTASIVNAVRDAAK